VSQDRSGRISDPLTDAGKRTLPANKGASKCRPGTRLQRYAQHCGQVYAARREFAQVNETRMRPIIPRPAKHLSVLLQVWYDDSPR